MTLVTRTLLKLIDPFLAKMQHMRRSQFEVASPIDADLLFLGDSITEFGLWNEWFPGRSVVNRGIAGDTSQGVLDRLDRSIGRQRLLFLLIGTNDLTRDVPVARIAANVRLIVRRCLAEAPGTRLFLQGVMPRAASYRGRIEALNGSYREIAAATGATFIDLFPLLADGSGAIRGEYSADKLHLTGPAYRAWVDTIGPLVDAEFGHLHTTRP